MDFLPTESKDERGTTEDTWSEHNATILTECPLWVQSCAPKLPKGDMRRVALWRLTQTSDRLQKALRRLGGVGIDGERRVLLVGREGFESRQLPVQDREVRL